MSNTVKLNKYLIQRKKFMEDQIYQSTKPLINNNNKNDDNLCNGFIKPYK